MTEVKNKKEFRREGPFSDDYEKMAREKTNPLGTGNAAYHENKSKLPQDKLVAVYGWTHGRTGFVSTFEWQSGRKDSYVEVDVENPDNLPHVHEQLINKAG